MTILHLSIFDIEHKKLVEYQLEQDTTSYGHGILNLLKKASPNKSYTVMRSKRNASLLFQIFRSELTILVAVVSTNNPVSGEPLDEPSQKNLNQEILTTLKTADFCFKANYGEDFDSKEDFSGFKDELEKIIESHNDNVKSRMGKMQEAKENLNEINNYMAVNINDAIERGDDLNELKEKSNFIEMQADLFQNKAKKVQDATKWQSRALLIAIIIGAMIVIIIIVVLLILKYI